jgi:pimeloyl-ACP methyl ester carboxylesterase
MPLARVKEVSLNYHIAGEGDPLILIAGFGVDNMCFVYQVPEFQKHFQVIVFDNRGIGKSTGSIGLYHIKTMADDTVQLLRYLDIKRSHVLGYSMGGMIAQEIAIRYPESVGKLMLCSTFAKQEMMVDIITNGIKELLGQQIHEFLEFKLPEKTYDKIFNYVAQQIFTEQYIKNNRDLIKGILEKYLSKITYGDTLLKQLGAIYRHDTLKRLNQIKSETLVMTGTADKLVNPECSEILAENIINSKLVKIPNAEHGFNFELPNVFNKNILDFLIEK